MNWKRIILIILLSPIIIPLAILTGIGIGCMWGIEYALTGKYNQDDGGR